MTSGLWRGRARRAGDGLSGMRERLEELGSGTRWTSLLDREVSEYEPRLAFDGGAFGVTILTRLIQEAPEFLKPESFLCFEVGLGQGNAITRMLERARVYRNLEPLFDESGEIRAFLAQT
jgi:methylase of polypeptide subunit release factors